MTTIDISGTGTTIPVRTTVISLLTQVASEQGKTLVPLSDDVALMDTGLDSLCIAIIVARLDDQFGVDPFGEADEVTLPVTVGDFIRIYENVRS
jgi:acyl carrier protein